MRNYSYRIYDKKRKEWVHGPGHEVHLFGETIIMGDILRRPDDTCVLLAELEDLEVQEDTGMVDKNKKRIYVGDICRMYIHRGIGYVETVGVAIWREEECQYLIKINSDLEISPDSFDKNFQPEGNSTAPEIIGNIYDNPNLIPV